jgi:hypothetical protein
VQLLAKAEKSPAARRLTAFGWTLLTLAAAFLIALLVVLFVSD